MFKVPIWNFKSNLVFGTDLYNGYCSGSVTEIKRKENGIFEIYTGDNNSFFEFKLKSIIIHIPKIVSDKSPIIFIESDNLEFEEEKWNKKYLEEYDQIQSLSYYKNKESDNIIYMNELNDDDIVEYDNFNSYERFFTKGIFCFLNIQGLEYNRNYARLVEKLKAMSGKNLEVELRNNILK